MKDEKTWFESRRTGVDAAQSGKWDQAAEAFLAGGRQAQTADDPLAAVGLMADAGFALGKAGKYRESVETWAETLRIFERLSNPALELASGAKRKLVGHTLHWLEHTLAGKAARDLFEPAPGACSDPEPNKEIQTLPKVPWEACWVRLAQIEYYQNTGSTVFEEVQRRFQDSKLLPVRLFLAELEVKHAFRQLAFDRLPGQSLAWEKALVQALDYVPQRKEGFDVDEIDRLVEGFRPGLPSFGTELLFFALVALVARNQLDPGLLETWRDQVRGLAKAEMFLHWIDLAQALLARAAAEASGSMRAGDVSRDERVLAALRVANEASMSAQDLFFAQILLGMALVRKPWEDFTAEFLSELLVRQWLELIRFPAALLRPQMTVPEIEAACKSEERGIKKTARILLAASHAVSVGVPQSFILQLRALSGNQD